MKDRLEVFRAYMAQFDAAADPARAVDRGQYVPGARALADRVRPRVELEPHSTHLLTGGVGSGKTTQLLVLRDAIAKLPDTTAIYIDVTRWQDSKHLHAGVLLVLAARELASRAPASFEGDAASTGVELDPPSAPGPLGADTLAKLEVVKTLHEAANPRQKHMVLLFDGLDRMHGLTGFREIVAQDVQALRSASMGVVLVGPIDVIYAKEKVTRDLFDAAWHLSPVDTATPQGLAFLTEVLRKRAPANLLPDEACARIAERSGGVLRDLIQLARAAGYEAYAAGADRIGLEHVEAAADALGRAQLQSVGQDGLEVLQRVRTKGTFIPTSDRDLALLASRNVLEYQDGARIRYAVHPTIEPLLALLAAA